MPNVQTSSTEIQTLLDQVATARKAIAAGGGSERAALAALEPGLRGIEQELGVAGGGRVDAAVWNALGEALQTSLRDRLQSTAHLLDAVSGSPADGPSDPKNIMHRAAASNCWIIILTAVGILLTIGVLVWVCLAWDGATNPPANSSASSDKGPTEGRVLRMIILMGALGGCLHWTSSLATFVGNGQLLRRWIPYYLIMPFEGAALAPVIYLLLRTGVLAAPPAGGTGGGTGQLNLVSLYAFAGLTGLFAKQAIEMLADVFTVIFKKIQAKDAVQDKKGTGDAGTSSTATPAGRKTP